jgi:hypothetical protein
MPARMSNTHARSISFSIAVLGLALVGGGLSYWSAARTPVIPVSSRMQIALDSMTALLALCAAALAVMGICYLLGMWSSGAPNWIQRCANLIGQLPLWFLVLPVALSASYVAARIGLSRDANANYWLALWLWMGALTLLVLAFVPRGGWVRSRPDTTRAMWSRILLSEVVVIAVLAAVSLSLRVVKLDAAPFLTNGDEEAMRPDVVAGNIRNMFAVGWGYGWGDVPRLLYFFPVAGAFKVLGTGVVAMRMVSALVGAAAVVVTYLLLREMFGRGQALTGALFMAAYHLHLHFSRSGLQNVWDTLAAASAMYFAYRASRSRRAFDFAALGLVCGLTLNLYVSARAATLVVIAYLIYVSILQRSFLRDNLGKIALAAVTFSLAAMPIGAFFLTHTEAIAARPNSELLFNTGWYQQQLDMGRSAVSVVWDQALHAFGGFVYYPMSRANANLYDTPHPLIPGLAAVPFIAGFVYSVFHIEKKEYALLLIALVLPTVAGGVLTYPPIQWQRFLDTVPAISGLVAVGLWQLADRLLTWRRSLVPLVAFPAVIFLAAQNIDLYFHAAVADVSYGAPIKKVTIDYVNTLPQDTRVYWFGGPEVWVMFVGLSLHDYELREVFDQTPELVPPVERPSPSVYMFMPHRESELAPLVAKCPGGTTKTLSFRGGKLLTVYELMAGNTCTPTLEPPPTNDSFLSPITAIALPFSHTISTKAASAEPGEPQPGPPQAGNPTPCGGVPNTAWYSFTPSTDMRLVAETVGSSADTVVAVYEGTDLASLTPVTCSARLPDHTAGVEFTARSGTHYQFQVAALSFSVGTVTFSLAQSSAP